LSVYAIRTDVRTTDCLDVGKATITTLALELRDGKGSASCGELSCLESKDINVLDWDACGGGGGGGGGDSDNGSDNHNSENSHRKAVIEVLIYLLS